jgi:hypothetical protein
LQQPMVMCIAILCWSSTFSLSGRVGFMGFSAGGGGGLGGWWLVTHHSASFDGKYLLRGGTSPAPPPLSMNLSPMQMESNRLSLPANKPLYYI